MADRLAKFDTQQLQKIDSEHHLHPFTDSKHIQKVGTRIITEGSGIYIRDCAGNLIIDGMAGLWCVNIGYGRSELVDAAADQLRRLPYYNTFFLTSHPPAVELTQLLSEVTANKFNHVFLTNSGSEANDTVIRMVRRYWEILDKPEKNIIISRENAYHGSTMGAGSLTGMPEMHSQGGLPIPNIEHVRQPYWYRDGGERSPDQFGIEVAQALEARINTVGVDRVAAFIAEPIQGAGGVIVPPATYWPEISRICKEYEIPLIADEVICGFGRTGKWFGSDYFNLDPDFVIVAKGLSSGYLPIAGVIVSDTIASVLIEQGGEFVHGFTYSGHPVCCAVATENIRILRREKIIETVDQTIGPYFQHRLRQLQDHPLVGEIRGVGLIAGIELVKDKTSKKRYAESMKVGIQCREISIRRGLVMRAVGDTMVLSPPLIISHSEIDDMVKIISDTLDETYGIVSQ